MLSWLGEIAVAEAMDRNIKDPNPAIIRSLVLDVRSLLGNPAGLAHSDLIPSLSCSSRRSASRSLRTETSFQATLSEIYGAEPRANIDVRPKFCSGHPHFHISVGCPNSTTMWRVLTDSYYRFLSQLDLVTTTNGATNVMWKKAKECNSMYGQERNPR